MKVSVVMAVYNGRKFIKEQLESIIQQTRPVDEIVIIEDCPPESCMDIINDCLRNYKGTAVVRQHSENKGFAETFFDAIELATGDILFYADQDDVWLENKVEVMLGAFEQSDKPQCISGLNIIIDKYGKELQREELMEDEEFIVDKKDVINQTRLRQGMTLAVNRSLVDLLVRKYDRTKFNNHDLTTELIASIKGTYKIINQYTARYRLHDNNASGMRRRFRLRTDRKGRIGQTESQMFFLRNFLSEYTRCEIEDDEVIKLFNRQLSMFNFRNEMLSKRKLFSYLVGVIKYIDCMSSKLIIPADIVCIIMG